MGGETIFAKIIRREVPAKIVYETDHVLAFHDVNPQAPIHILIIPKEPIRDLASAKADHKELLGELLVAVNEIAREQGLLQDGFRVVINNGARAGQTVFHLHLHLMGGRSFAWPPG
ncbi:MAG: histidine triad nucleotide-binding protein [Oligoflexia bacterium]|nr:histidine triad nucleotide-binding protein [Oligoflexia bacterium]